MSACSIPGKSVLRQVSQYQYKRSKTRFGRHVDHPNWRVYGVWQFQRSDGLMTAHKMESPWSTWRDTIEDSMRLADKYIPIGGDLPEGMRSKGDPDYGPLWDRDDESGDPEYNQNREYDE